MYNNDNVYILVIKKRIYKKRKKRIEYGKTINTKWKIRSYFKKP